ncbi:MAG: zinc ABC transporter solute-binding protein [Gammaproteobacteria bacterium]|nr:zinc ABC transporter solute-binding protein [Gammaproteobacteria bacterium]
MQPNIHQTLKRLTACLILFTLPGITYATNSENNTGPIVVTIKPLYSLVAHLTDGIEQPLLLMKQMQSPHHYTMRPSERRLLSDARVIVWIGPQMESYLSKIIQQQNTIAISAMQANGLTLLDRRTKNSPQHTADDAASDSLDPHIWLSSQNAIAISKHISQQLILNDPENTYQYKDNLQKLVEKIARLSAEIKKSLNNSNRPFITYHDAFQYFEDENKLNYIDSISFDEETGVSLKHLRHIKTSIEKNNIHCLVYQPPEPDIIKTLTNKATIKAMALDPLGQNVSNDKEAWFEIMRDIAINFKNCLNS